MHDNVICVLSAS